MRFSIFQTVAIAVLSAAALASTAQAQVPEGQLEGAPERPPIVQGPPGAPSPYPCNLDGDLLDYVYEPADQTMKAAMIFVDFPGRTGEDTDPRDLYEGFVPPANAAFAELSRGTFDVSVDPLLEWMRLPKSYEQYGMDDAGGLNYKEFKDLFADALTAADPLYDFSKVSSVFVVMPPTAPLRSFVYIGDDIATTKTDGVRIANSSFLGTQSSDLRGHQVFLHETGHLIGLPDLYAESNTVSQPVGPWDVMSDTYQPNIPMMAWTRLLVGWLDKPDFRCTRQSTTASLTAVTAAGGRKGLVVRTGPAKGFVVEARSDSVSNCGSTPGLLVYSVSTARFEGAIRVGAPPAEDLSCGDRARAQLAPGASFTDPAGRFVITAVAQRGSVFDVRLEISDTACRVPRLQGLRLGAAVERLVAAGCSRGKVSGPSGKKRRVVDQGQAPGTVRRDGATVNLFLE